MTFLSIALSLSISSLWAQVEVGIKIGGMLSGIAAQGIGLTSSDNASQTKFSYLAGGSVAVPLHPRLNLHTELLYANKGNNVDVDPLNAKNNFHYLSVPILLQYTLTDRLGVAVGPEINYLIGAYQKLLGNIPLNDIKAFDVALDIDLQYSLLEKLSLGLRYNLGLYDITERLEAMFSDGTTISIDSKAYNRTLQLSLLYWF